ncbi:MAG TPA: glycosyltransferase family 2 protein, partial [Nitrospirota bacterium]|nr:glycosyltransferase family 2 protein [Nitrospirota bacterium]
MTSQEAPAGVAVIIVTYNSGQYVKDCLESLGRQTVKPRAVVVVDNASSDDTVDAARAFGADVIVNAGNAGFAAGNNIGARHAVGKYGPEYVLLLNPDTVAHERMIEELQTTLDADPRAGIAQGKIFLLREKGILNTDGICHHYLYFGYCGGYGLPDRDEGDREIAVASGACLMIRRDVLERVGYLFLDEFFMYHEDTDLCIRARLLGYK